LDEIEESRRRDIGAASKNSEVFQSWKGDASLEVEGALIQAQRFEAWERV
jgi:hypothetical protein